MSLRAPTLPGRNQILYNHSMISKGITALLTATGLYTTVAGINFIAKKEKAFRMARSLVNNKGIINLGAGIHRSAFALAVANSPEVVVNVDLVPDGLSNYITVDLEETPWPFQDKEFDVAFMSHVLEHLENWEQALQEAQRIADYVVLVLPHPLSLAGHLSPEHRQHFGFDDLQILKNIPGIFIYY